MPALLLIDSWDRGRRTIRPVLDGLSRLLEIVEKSWLRQNLNEVYPLK